MTEPDEPGKGATSYALSPKGKPSDGKSKIKPAPLELNQVETGSDKVKERGKEQEKDEAVIISRKGTRIGHRRIDEDGQITYKKQPSSALVSAIQLGIQYSVGRLSSKVERDVLMGDFYEIESVFFPSVGRQETPAHHYSDFRFKAYAPVAFRYFRELFHIAPDDFLISLCHEPLRELTNPGASGSLFYCSMDDQFIIKTVQHKEAEFLQKLLPGYYLNLNQNKRTLLPKFFGLYCYQCGGKNIRLVLMNNLLPSGYKIHLKYDLKGSTYKRKASKAERAKSSPTLKDLDFMNDHPEGISLDSETYTALVKTIQRDCRVLESFKIMDYSLLLAIHNVDEAAREKRGTVIGARGIHSSPIDKSFTWNAQHKDNTRHMNRGEASSTAGTKPTEAAATNKEDRKASEKSTDEQAKVHIGSASVARNPSARNRDDFAAYWEAIPQHRDDTPYGAIRARNSKGDRLLLFIGVIDILQSYRFKKRLEHGLKSVVQDGDAISVHRPSFYARRFQEFMSEKVFRKLPGAKGQIARSPSKKRASFNTGRGKERVRTSSDTDKHVNRVAETGNNLASKAVLSPSLETGLANVVPGDVSFMGRETKSLEVMTKKLSEENSESLPVHDLSTDTHDDSTTTHDDSTMTHDVSTITQDDSMIMSELSTLHDESTTTNEHLPNQENKLFSNSEVLETVQTVSKGVEVSQITPEHTKVSFRNDQHEEITETISLEQELTAGNGPKNEVALPSTFDDVPSTSDGIASESHASSISDGVPSTSDVPKATDGIRAKSDANLEISILTENRSDVVMIHNIHENVDNVQEASDHNTGSNEVFEETSNVENTESFKRQFSSESAVVDSKI